MKRILVCLSLAVATSSLAVAERVRGFIEPYRSVMISSAEMGLLAAVHVTEGQRVNVGDVLGQLDDRVLQSTLDIMETANRATGAMEAAQSDLKVKQQMLNGYVELSRQGNASEREIERATGEVDQAIARVKASKEQAELRQMEYQRTLVQIEQKKLRAPMNGIVVEIVKEPGEFISPTDPVVMKLIQIDTLKCSLTVPHHAATGIRVGQALSVTVGANETRVDGIVEFVSPVIDPQSGTTMVKIRLPNKDDQLKAGLVCRCEFGVSTYNATIGLQKQAPQ